LSPRRKCDSVSLATMSCGRLFHSRAPATAKARSPTVEHSDLFFIVYHSFIHSFIHLNLLKKCFCSVTYPTACRRIFFIATDSVFRLLN